MRSTSVTALHLLCCFLSVVFALETILKLLKAQIHALAQRSKIEIMMMSLREKCARANETCYYMGWGVVNVCHHIELKCTL
jgi:hypothetical protein